MFKFRWKQIRNEERRYEIHELINKDYVDQMNKSKAQIFRHGMNKEDVLKEPLTIFFSSMVAFGK